MKNKNPFCATERSGFVDRNEAARMCSQGQNGMMSSSTCKDGTERNDPAQFSNDKAGPVMKVGSERPGSKDHMLPEVEAQTGTALRPWAGAMCSTGLALEPKAGARKAARAENKLGAGTQATTP
ncbi:unnamed protein product [Toxocara canis]|uniref:IncF plasmid conjugative transfer protein TraN n=1 Tax=Toxocara canis TaxID=6265 RepID=A0A183UQV3_TOXCA|nr:unnamed protein product [Toxocara canis]